MRTRSPILENVFASLYALTLLWGNTLACMHKHVCSQVQMRFVIRVCYILHLSGTLPEPTAYNQYISVALV